MIEVLFFGELAELVGSERMRFEGIDSSAALDKLLLERFPKLSEKRYRIAVNQTLILDSQDLKSGDTVAFLPPFAGG